MNIQIGHIEFWIVEGLLLDLPTPEAVLYISRCALSVRAWQKGKERSVSFNRSRNVISKTRFLAFSGKNQAIRGKNSVI